MKNERVITSGLSLFNALILTLYIMNYDISSRFFLKLLYSALFLCVLSFLMVKFRGKIFRYFQNIQITFFSIIVLFLIFEFLAWLFPTLIPLQMRIYLVSRNISNARVKMVEYLDESPFVKFQPNTIIRTQGYYGNDQQFVYEWKTDRLGFKNSAIMAKKDRVDIVALGNSFTEGMGVATENTWPSLLINSGYSVYNLGVQGYAPTQLEGSLRKYGLQLNPQYIIIGYCASTFKREKAFFDQGKAIQNKEFTGGIQSIVNVELRNEIRSQARYVSSAFYMLARSIILNLMLYHRLAQSVQNIEIHKGYKAYKSEILFVASKTEMMEEIEKNSPEWKSTLLAFDNIIKMAEKIDAKVILLYLPRRGGIYYKAATGKELPESYFEKIEAQFLKQYAERMHITFLNPSERLRTYVENLPIDDMVVLQLPYLEIDGHMSCKGHELVAQEVFEYLKNAVE